MNADGRVKGIRSFVVDVTDEVKIRKNIEEGKAAFANERDNFYSLFRPSLAIFAD